MTKRSAFTLAEVVLALGVISIAIVAILGVLPIGLSTSHSAQDETRFPQIAQDILSSLASQAETQFPNATLRQAATSTASDFTYNIVLTNSSGYTFSADNDGHLAVPSSSLLAYPYQVSILINANPTGFEKDALNQPTASEVTIRIITPPSANWSTTPTSKQTSRDYVRIISKY